MKLKITTLIIIEGNQVENIITTQTQVQPSTSTYVPKTN